MIKNKIITLCIFLMCALHYSQPINAMNEDEKEVKIWKLKSIHDSGKRDSICENEGCATKIRYIYKLEHTLSREERNVGYVCAAHMIENIEKLLRWVPRDFNNNQYQQWMLRKVSIKTGRPGTKTLAYASSDIENPKIFSFSIDGNVEGPFTNIEIAKKAAIKKYLEKEKD